MKECANARKCNNCEHGYRIRYNRIKEWQETTCNYDNHTVYWKKEDFCVLVNDGYFLINIGVHKLIENCPLR